MAVVIPRRKHIKKGVCPTCKVHFEDHDGARRKYCSYSCWSKSRWSRKNRRMTGGDLIIKSMATNKVKCPNCHTTFMPYRPIGFRWLSTQIVPKTKLGKRIVLIRAALNLSRPQAAIEWKIPETSLRRLESDHRISEDVYWRLKELGLLDRELDNIKPPWKR